MMIASLLRFPIVVALLLLSVAAFSQTDKPTVSDVLTTEPYVIQTFDGRKIEAELGRLRVKEQPGSTTTVQIAFVRLKSTSSAKPGSSPIVFLMGGAGRGIVMPRIPPYYRLFERLREFGDVVILDQRGIGLAEPNLEIICEAHTFKPPLDALINPQHMLDAQLAAIRSCAELVRSKGIDLTSYTVATRASDLDELRHALSADKLRLLAWSAGTEVALEYIRRFGASVESAVLAGTVGPDNILSLPSTSDIHLRKLAALVAADPEFRSRRSLFETVQGLRRTLEQTPIRIAAEKRESGEPAQIEAGWIAFHAALQSEMSDGRAITGIPDWIYALEDGNSQPFQRKAEGMYRSLRNASLLGLVLGCERGWSQERLERVRKEAKTALLNGDGSPLPQACAMLGIQQSGHAEDAIFSPLRTLFISGTLDSSAPPFQAEHVRFGFPNGSHVVVTNATHDTLVLTAVQELIAAFMRGDEVRTETISAPAPRFSQAPR